MVVGDNVASCLRPHQCLHGDLHASIRFLNQSVTMRPSIFAAAQKQQNMAFGCIP